MTVDRILRGDPFKAPKFQANVKPGTRCECDALHGQHYRERNINGPPLNACPNEAVRIVTVEPRVSMGQFMGLAEYPEAKSVPMCAPCATFHAARQKAGA